VSATVGQLKKWGCKKIVVVSIVGTVEGVELMRKDHPDVTMFVASATDLMVDGKVVPGMGDCGDRQFFSAEMDSVPNDITLSGAHTKTQKRKK
jgi:uracil phosphoribosyltransferase